METRRSIMERNVLSEWTGAMDNEISTTWTTLLVAAALGAGVVGGVLYAFSAFVMRGLDRVPTASGVLAMQQVNLAAPRAPLMVPLMGTALLSVVLLVRGVVLLRGGQPTGWFVLAGAVLYLAAFVITAAYHVPRNDALAALDPTAPGTAAAWQTYVADWTRMNHVRAAAAIAASLAFALALVRR
jgi:uncharacterized membrane protein